jgi:hypothetical protein
MLKIFRQQFIVKHMFKYKHAIFGVEIGSLRVKKIIFPQIMKLEVFP